MSIQFSVWSNLEILLALFLVLVSSMVFGLIGKKKWDPKGKVRSWFFLAGFHGCARCIRVTDALTLARLHYRR